MRPALAVSLTLLLISCGGGQPGAKQNGIAKAKITQFYSTEKKVPKGLKGSLCYGVENAARVQLAPPVDEVWPSLNRCFEISPAKKTTYTLTAVGEDGSTDTKSVDVDVAAAPPRLYDMSVNKIEVHAGEEITLCFKVENTTSVKASPGRFDKSLNCLFDRPKKTTTYKIQALGGDHEMDSGTVTVKVH